MGRFGRTLGKRLFAGETEFALWGAKISVLPANRRFLAVRTEFWHPTGFTHPNRVICLASTTSESPAPAPSLQCTFHRSPRSFTQPSGRQAETAVTGSPISASRPTHRRHPLAVSHALLGQATRVPPGSPLIENCRNLRAWRSSGLRLSRRPRARKSSSRPERNVDPLRAFS
jgi:hypothetical protein